MRVHRHITNLSPLEKEQFEMILEQKTKRFLPIVKKHHPDVDTTKLDAHVEKIDKRTVYKIEYVLTLPKGRLVASEAKHHLTECMDLATDKLEGQITKHFGKAKHR